MKLSIITINYNNCEGLRKTIDSVVAQTCKDFEWIIVDGGSTDGSRELIEETAACLQSEGWPVEHFSLLGFTAEDWKAYPDPPEGKENVDSVSNEKVLKWCSEPDKGIYNAMNKGIVKAQGEYCLFLNSGDWLYSYDVLDKVIASNFSSDFVVGCVEYDFGITHPFDESYSLYHLTHHSFPHQGSFIRNSIFEDYGLYNERFKVVSDWEIFIKALVHGLATVEFVETLVAGMERGGISFDNNILKCEHEILKKKYFSIQLYKDLQYSESLSYVVHTSYITKLLYRLLFRFSTLIRLIQKK